MNSRGYADANAEEQTIGRELTSIDRPAGGYTESEIRYLGVPLLYLTLQPEQYTAYWAGKVDAREFVGVAATLGVDDRAECLLATAEAGEADVPFQHLSQLLMAGFDVRFLRISAPRQDYTWHTSSASPSGRVVGLIGDRWDRTKLWRYWHSTWQGEITVSEDTLNGLEAELDDYLVANYRNYLAWRPLVRP